MVVDDGCYRWMLLMVAVRVLGCCSSAHQLVVHQQQPFFVVEACTASFIHPFTARSISSSLDLTDLLAWRASGVVAVSVFFRRRFGVFWRPNRRGHDSAAATSTKMLLLPYPLLRRLVFFCLSLVLMLYLSNPGVGSDDTAMLYPSVKPIYNPYVLSISCFYVYCMLIFFVSSMYGAGRCYGVVSAFCVVYTFCVLNPEFHFASDSWISFNAILYGKRNPIGEIDDTSSGDFPNWFFKKISAFKCPGVCCLRPRVWGNVPFGPGLHTSSFSVAVFYFLIFVWFVVIVRSF